MRNSLVRRGSRVLALVLLLGGGGLLVYRSSARSASPPRIMGVVRQTEIRIAPDTSGRLAAFRVAAGQEVRKGDILAVLQAPELAAAVEEARANAAGATADRTNVFAGTRKEEVDIAAQNVRIAQANLALAQQQHARAVTLSSRDFASKQQLDETSAALSKAQADLGLMQAISDQSRAGPTKEERAIAEAGVALALATVADLEAKFAKTTIRAPVDGRIGILVARPGEAISPGQPVMTLLAHNERWFTFTIKEDLLEGITIGSPLRLSTARGDRIDTRVTELRPLGEFAVWRAARAVGDHDINSFLVRSDPVAPSDGLEAGMTVWLDR
ncbi:HlyD family secretion protein [Rhizobiales bacterium GAS191]|nr:HlyD family secretion protein [Rhizobiales bacterium GAS113]SED79453.1 HlyD family secretion protein [Rhizobiales bacterium GAS191]SEE67966.1 HlyD family secretion protein [Rhizobiales bacterium GAS188]